MLGGRPNVTTANRWRWEYPRPPDAMRGGQDVARLLGDNRRTQKSDRDQRELHRTTGFPGNAEVGHAVRAALLRRGYPRTLAHFGGQLAAVGGSYNFMGNPRIAEWLAISDRQVRRLRARLEEDRWITSYTLEPGDKIDGQRQPVKWAHVVRDVSKLQRLARLQLAIRDNRRKQPRSERAPSAAEKAPTAPAVTAEDFAELARSNPEYSAFFGAMEAAKRQREEKPIKPPPEACNPPPTKEEIDHWDQVTEAADALRREHPEWFEERDRPVRD